MYLHKDLDSDFDVSFSDLPGSITVGKTLKEGHRMTAEALEELLPAGLGTQAGATPKSVRCDTGRPNRLLRSSVRGR